MRKAIEIKIFLIILILFLGSAVNISIIYMVARANLTKTIVKTETVEVEKVVEVEPASKTIWVNGRIVQLYSNYGNSLYINSSWTTSTQIDNAIKIVVYDTFFEIYTTRNGVDKPTMSCSNELSTFMIL